VGLFLLVSVSALSISAGETIYRDLQGEIEDLQSFECTLTAQTYDLNGTNFTMNSTGWILSLDLGFKPDNLTVDCLLNGQRWVSSGGGSGGSSTTIPKTYNDYVCSEWSECSELGQRRICTINGTSEKPVNMITWRTCEMPIEKTCEELGNCPIEEPVEEPEEKGFLKKVWQWILDLFSRNKKS